MDIEQEKEIIRRVLAGEREAYAIIVENYKRPVYNLCYRLTGVLNDADDLAQDIFIRAYNQLKRFDTDRNFFPWFYTIALNIIRNHQKKKKNIQVKNIENTWNNPQNNASPDPEQRIFDKEESEKLQACVNQLPFIQQEAVVLRYYQELPFEEIAEILSISLSAAKMRVYRGLDGLNKLMKEKNRF